MSAAPEPLIREMSLGDVAAVARLEAVAYTFPWSEGIFRDCLRAGYYCCVAEITDTCVGYAIMSAGAGEAHVLNLCVAEGFRRGGIGSSLLQHLTDVANDARVQEMFLEVRPSNMIALGLYQSRGFARIGLRRGYYQAVDGREDAVVLRKRLVRGGN
ncbi:MAG TPA: ribosomal protein S18-alanine N-acetyltransferase [Steroidobacteraceae bacterium]|nr:ribosomal protein S18-alanine N-acetyltransferase [Steroidobacteraceae bacterium]